MSAIDHAATALLVEAAFARTALQSNAEGFLFLQD